MVHTYPYAECNAMKYPPEITYAKLVDWCNKGERCRHNIRQKLQRWQVDSPFIDECIARLEKSHLLDDTRFAAAFAHDKSTLQRWGAHKIRLHLRARGISEGVIQDALSTIQTDLYADNLQELAQRKWGSIKGKNDFERTAKLIQFLLRKGFSYELIKKTLAHANMDSDAINHL